jgi:hypothetical protein
MMKRLGEASGQLSEKNAASDAEFVIENTYLPRDASANADERVPAQENSPRPLEVICTEPTTLPDY